MKEAMPFVTQNTKLAQALQCVGCELLDVWNVYDSGTLRGMGFDTVGAARKAGKPGHVSYFFQRTPKLDECLRVWDEAGAQIKSGGEYSVDCENSDMIRIARMVLDNRAPFAALWKSVIPKFIESNGDPENHVEKRLENGMAAEGTITHPGFRVVSVNASKRTREVCGV